MALLNFTSGTGLRKSINSSRWEWVLQKHVLPSTYKGGDAEFVVTKKQASCVGWNNFCSLNGKIQHFSKIVPIKVAQHLKAHCTIMWMKDGIDFSWPRFETTREEDLKEISIHIWKSISFCAVPPKLSEAKCHNSKKLNRFLVLT